ncbi:hypothetical protein AVEN_130685-1 [Araneus ventricosus]|uniref:Uncharacterized protein n=1 Tax=Araneus ventricosus TaxID=182803 RepID=A0A4Y2QPR8_ARAVE|nr:hypothetical protein AVEN_130685-1 [Araneus ventricosus]
MVSVPACQLYEHGLVSQTNMSLKIRQNLNQHRTSKGFHDSSSDIDECLNGIKFTTPKDKKGKIKSNKAKKDACQDDNNEQLDHTCDADMCDPTVCEKECSENYYKTKRKCD